MVTRLKQEIRREIGVVRVFAHVEPSLPDAQPAREVTDVEPRVLSGRRAGGALGGG